MYQLTTLLIVLSAFFLSVLAAPLPDAKSLDKRTTHYGRGTWFNVGEGACGDWNVNSDSIVAISAQIYGSGGNCGQWVHVTNTANGKSAYGLTRDECESCGAGDLDMSPGLFEQIGDLSTGVLSISWNFEAMGWSP
ncbi:RlpA-like double-psi beta-barrel-protein domain-containing protein-containing protein [Melanogaster broomeanus]|nr:RlpA-like double-psi beta-barrel-protein domain-containing protein-containing protein [Melanogaster broomeanus]